MSVFRVKDTVVLRDPAGPHAGHTGSVVEAPFRDDTVHVLWEDGDDSIHPAGRLRLFRGTDDRVTEHQARTEQSRGETWLDDPYWPTVYENVPDAVIAVRLKQLEIAMYENDSWPPDEVVKAILHEAAARLDNYGNREARR